MTFWDFADKHTSAVTTTIAMALIVILFVGIAWAERRGR